jgi:hypothetical protein
MPLQSLEKTLKFTPPLQTVAPSGEVFPLFSSECTLIARFDCGFIGAFLRQ